MKIEDGKIVEATERELFKYYLDSEWYEIYPFDEYLDRMKQAGVKIIDEQD